ncbi:MAG TPA: PKD domain-containing protein, partial [Candidatus Paceibacterota bacterium]|nr:PKD domain-containing protein [Candidatus Paceibacterota bacterium]
DGTILDSLDALSGWPAGDSATKQTMQWSGGAWITATATPKAANVKLTVGDSSENTNSSATTTAESATQVNYSYSSHSGSSELSREAKNIKAYLGAGRDRVVLTGTPVQFSAKFTDESGSVLYGDNYKWSFGDAGYSQGEKTAHIYDIAGEYVVVLSATFGGQEYTSRANIKAVPPELKVEAIVKNNGGYVVYVTNNGANEVNLKGWQLRTRRRFFILDADIIVMPKKTIPLSDKYTNMDLSAGEEMELLYPTGKIFEVIKAGKESDVESIKRDKECSPRSELCSATGVDKGVDNPVDNVGTELWKKELLSLEEQLRGVQNSLSANISTLKRVPVSVENEEKIKDDRAVVEQVATTTDNVEKIVISPQKRESTLWKFLRGIFGRK